MKATLSLCALLLVGLLLHAPSSRAAAPPALDRARLALLLQQLDDDDYERRVEADRGLRACGKLVLPVLHAEMEKTPSLEVRKRLEGIIHELSADEHVPELVRLLAERQADVWEQADHELRRYGKVVVPLLRKELKTASGDDLRRRLEKIIDELGTR